MENILSKFPFYIGLSEKGKTIFRNRLEFFIANKKFIGKEGLEVTSEMKYTIGACAIQLTFGLKNYLLEHFTRLYIYPDVYQYFDKWHKGTASQNGFICLSWKDVEKGVDDSEDGISVALHELAHALEICYLFSDNFNTLFANMYDLWETEVNKTISTSSDDSLHFIRDYAYTNPKEFFAVCCELFFEKPHQLKRFHPVLFAHLCFLLNLDTTNTNKNDYLPNTQILEQLNLSTKDIRLVQKRRRFYINAAWHWSMTVAIIGIFIGTISISLLSSFTMVSKEFAWCFIILVAIISFIKQKAYFEKYANLGWFIYGAYNIFGIGVNAWATILLLNSLTAINEPNIEKNKVTNITESYDRMNGKDLLIVSWGENNESFQTEKFTATKNPKFITVHYNRGLLGMKIIKNIELEY